jgi:hypothetical protein
MLFAVGAACLLCFDADVAAHAVRVRLLVTTSVVSTITAGRT